MNTKESQIKDLAESIIIEIGVLKYAQQEVKTQEEYKNSHDEEMRLEFDNDEYLHYQNVIVNSTNLITEYINNMVFINTNF